MKFKRLILVLALFSVFSLGFSPVFGDKHGDQTTVKCAEKEGGECAKACDKKCAKECKRECKKECKKECKHDCEAKKCKNKPNSCCGEEVKKCDKGQGKAVKGECAFHGQKVAQANLESNEGGSVKGHCEKGKGKDKECDKGKGRALKGRGCPANAMKAGCCPMRNMAGGSKKGVCEGSSVSKDSAIYNLNFTLKDHNGNEVTLADNAGKVVVLEWLNYDCPFDEPHYQSGEMQKLEAKWSEKGVVWLTVNSTHYSDAKSNRSFAEKYNVSAPILIDSDGKVGKKFGARTTPHIFIIGQDGNLVYRGAFDNAPRGKVQGEEYVNYVEEVLSALTVGDEVEYSYVKPYGCSVKYAK